MCKAPDPETAPLLLWVPALPVHTEQTQITWITQMTQKKKFECNDYEKSSDKMHQQQWKCCQSKTEDTEGSETERQAESQAGVL